MDPKRVKEQNMDLLHHTVHKVSDHHEWVLFLHGAGGSSRLWTQHIKAFKDRFNILLVDLRGHGQSNVTPTHQPYTLDLLTHDVTKVMDVCGVQSAHVVGISLGAILQRWMVHRVPERVRSLVMVGAITRFDQWTWALVNFGHTVKSWIPFMTLYRLFAWIIMPKRNHKATRRLFVREAKKMSQQEFLRWFELTKKVPEAFKLFRQVEIPVPTLFIMGEEDHLFLKHVKQLTTIYPSYGLEIFSDCGHVCSVEKPRLFDKSTLAFYKTLKPASPKG
ncbi:MAG: alpha/beta fold hydrolase [Rhodothermaceae bacterium TMED105]|nr:MAG: alpha/beta fold hydrolase [Rhodothermaceae bacterium TMED105]|tara:strand:- start:11773 stop:12600 length:828 start_codon:yes stop_codon:yes gene_type:complete